MAPSGSNPAMAGTSAGATTFVSNRPRGSRARGSPGICRPAARTASQEAGVYSFAATRVATPVSAGVASAIQPLARLAGIHCESTSWLRST